MRAWPLILLCACAAPKPQPPRMEYPGALVPPSALGADFMLRQKISATFGESKEISFEAVLQKVGDQLTLIGLTPFGSRAFLLQQKGTEIEFTNYVDKELPFPPKYILLDIQRTLRIEQARADGTHELRDAEEHVRETWKDGRIVERRIRRLDDKPPGELVIVYEGGMPPGEPPPTMHFDNGWFGYRLTIETTEARKL
jgi:hypothetical protein